MGDRAGECPADDTPEVLCQRKGGIGRDKLGREVVVGGVRGGVVTVNFLLCAAGAARAGGVEGPGRGEVSVKGANEFEDASEEEKGGGRGGGGGFVAGELGCEVGVSDEGREEANVSVRGDKGGWRIVGG